MIFDDPKNKPKTPPPKNDNSWSKELDQIIMFLIESLQEMVVLTFMGFSGLLRLCYIHRVVVPFSLLFLFFGSRVFVKHAYHLTILRNFAPEFFTWERMRWFYGFTLDQHHYTFFALLISFIALLIGFQMVFTRNKFRRIFRIAGLTNGEGDTPKLVYRKKLDKNRMEYDFDANGIGISEFKDKEERIMSLFKMDIESIQYGKNQGRIMLTFNKKKMPKKITYQEISEQKVLPANSFYVGHSSEGVVTQDISKLPHMLIAGTTDAGKSFFFKQCLVGLLESTKHIQAYIIDLKGGLEAIDFKAAPNVKIVKTMQDAVILLRLVKKEMEERFAYLEEKGLKIIDPERDKKDRIIVAVDEASVLYMERSRYDDNFKLALEARNLADSISKLSRAASINLILATQKLDRTVIPVSVSENISGRMALKANSLQGSLVVLGSKDSFELPKIPGRGIWNVGSKKIIVQTPYLKDEEIKSFCKRIANEFEADEKSLHQNLITDLYEKESEETEGVLKMLVNKGFGNETKK